MSSSRPSRLPDDSSGPAESAVSVRRDEGGHRHRAPRSDVLRALGEALIAMSQLDGVIGDIERTGAERTDWEDSVDRARCEWRAVQAALARGAASGDLIYVSVADGAVVPYDVPRVERLTGRLHRLRVRGIAQGDAGR